MQSSTFGERVTAAVSTLVAIAILGAAVTAQQASGPVADAVADFESDLRYQIELTLRDDGAALKAAHEAVDHTLTAWHASPQSAVDRRLLLEWFDAAISATMPGHSGRLPAQPEFTSERPIIVAPPAQVPTLPAAEPPPVAPEPTEAPAAPASEKEPTATSVDVPASVSSEPPSAIVVEDREEVEAPPSAEAAPDEHSITIAPVSEHMPEEPAIQEAPLAFPESASDADTNVDSTETENVARVAPPVGETPYEAFEATSEPTDVNVNLAELNARIEGYHQQLASIEAAMVVEDTVAGPRLTALVDRIEQLAGQYQFVKLYYDSLTDGERRRVSELRTLDDAIALAAGLAAREQDASDFLADFEAEGAAPTLADRLRTIAEASGVAQ